jgi:small ligand-binding sensory domain FIST
MNVKKVSLASKICLLTMTQEISHTYGPQTRKLMRRGLFYGVVLDVVLCAFISVDYPAFNMRI